MLSSGRAQPRVQVTVYVCCEMSLGVPTGLGKLLLGWAISLLCPHVLKGELQPLLPLGMALDRAGDSG